MVEYAVDKKMSKDLKRWIVLADIQPDKRTPKQIKELMKLAKKLLGSGFNIPDDSESGKELARLIEKHTPTGQKPPMPNYKFSRGEKKVCNCGSNSFVKALHKHGCPVID